MLIQTILFTTFAFTATVGNILVALSIIYMKHRRGTGHFFILSLTLSDLYCGLIVMPLSTTELHAGATVTTTPYWCKMTAGLALTAILGTAWNLVLVSIDRFISIGKPLHYQVWMTPRVVITSIVSLWVVVVIWAFMPLIGWSKSIDYQRSSLTLCVWPMILDNNYFTITLVLVFIAVFLVAILQGIIFAIAKKQARSVRDRSSISKDEMSRMRFARMQRKITRVIGIIVGFFMLTYLPWMCILAYNMWSKAVVGQISILVALCLIYFNSVANPWIYTFSDRRILTEIKSLLRCHRRPEQQMPSSEIKRGSSDKEAT